MTLSQQQHKQCIVILGGSFDPVHNGHVALGAYFAHLMRPDVLRIIPTGNPWQKNGLQASAQDRLAMARLAFTPLATPNMPVYFDEQEMQRTKATYTIDTLKTLRKEYGDHVSLVFLMGADQLQHLNTWQEWEELFDYAHLCAASRPGYSVSPQDVPTDVIQAFTQRLAAPSVIKSTAHGHAYLATDLFVDITSTDIRQMLANQHQPQDLLPPAVLDYIQQHQLYKI